VWEFRELLAQGGSQYVRLAVGLTQRNKIAAIAESYHSAVVTHTFLGPVLTAAAVHLDTSIPNFMLQECTLADEDPKWEILENATRREGGWLAPAHAQHVHETPLRTDGSVLNAV
jgi:galactonate dehydratase